MNPILIYSAHVFTYWSISLYYDNYIKNLHKLTQCIIDSLLNQLSITLPFIMLYFNNYPFNETIWSSFLHLPFLILSNDVYFYFSHLAFHKYAPSLHNHHHERETFAAKALDANIIEHIFCNLFSVFCGVQILYMLNVYLNFYFCILWTIITTANSCLGHSRNYDRNGDHIVHHKYRNCNYGTVYFVDQIMGTYRPSISTLSS